MEPIERKVGDKMFVIHQGTAIYVKVIKLPNSNGIWRFQHIHTGTQFDHIFPDEEDEEQAI